MSGGQFNYDQYRISEIADEIERMIENNGRQGTDSYGYPLHSNYPPEVIEKFREAIPILRKAYTYAQRIDWYVSGDDGEDSFLRRLNEELSTLEEA